jgi:two-component sensor histidine kinase
MEAMLEPTNQTTCFDGALLMRELSHRINNEFASAISVISLTAARSGSSEVKAALSDVSDRLHRYADVHRTLQMPEYHTCINAALYLQQLCLSISRSRLEPNNIKLILAVRPLSIPSDRCWRLGMIVYELITNSARHAFQGTEGKVLVQLHSAENFVECRVSDNGRSPPQIQRGRGLAIIHELAEHVDGRFEQSFGIEGSSSLLIFPS